MFHGSMVALITPMLADGRVDFASLAQLIDRQIEHGTQSIVLLGTTGEGLTLSNEESEHIIKLSLERVNQRVPVIIGTGRHCTKLTIERTRRAMELGADAALVVTPSYIKPPQRGLVAHYKAIADAVPMPIIVYNAPHRTGCDLSLESIRALSNISNIIGIKETHLAPERLSALAALCQAQYFDLYCGNDEMITACLAKGAKGAISVVANVVPHLVQQLCQMTSAENSELSNRLAPLIDALNLEINPIAVKWALCRLGYIGPTLRLPLTPLAEALSPRLEQALEHCNLLAT